MKSNANKIYTDNTSPAELPLVSVIIPTFNRAHLLKETVESVFAQTWRPIELIVVDDGSTDDTPETCKALKEISSRNNVDFVYYRKKNAGVSATRNTGTKLAKGVFIQYLDSDDLIHPKKLETQVSFLLQHPECGLCLSAYVRGTPQNHRWSANLEEPMALVYHVDSRSFLNPQTASPLYRKSLLNKIEAWEEGYSICEDLVFLMRALVTAQNVGIDNNKFVLLREHAGERLSVGHSDKWRKENLEMRRLLGDIIKKTPLAYQKKLTPTLYPHLFSHAKNCLAKGRREIAKGYIKEAKRLPLTDKQRNEMKKVDRISTYPTFIVRALFRLNFA